ncbi:MAG: DMT family transporter [Betaproteobacteria bacterium]|jgi:drug/metabolite transporter (DMT)-like permease|nr:DMT family transporter [Betaproteobacteria bacterium]
MRSADVARLVALAMIWSASFVFFRVLAQPVGPVATVTFRVLVAGLVLTAWLALTARDADVRGNWRGYLFMGVVNSAIPFTLFAWAAYTLPASVMAILNAATPMFTALLAARWLGESLDGRRVGGIAAGVAGVALVTGGGAIEASVGGWLAVAACLAATFCYAWTGVWLKRRGAALSPYAVAAWSQLFAGLVLLPLVPLAPPPGPVTPAVLANLLGLALLCSAVAFLLYYRLMRDIGPTRTMTVTFLIPAFGIAWGALLLGERITLATIAGMLLIAGGTAGVLWRRAPSAA